MQIRRPCNKPGCSVLTTGTYCPAHAKAAQPAWRTTTGSSTSRGYGSKWRKLRKEILARDPVCTLCNRRPSEHVDHITSKAAGGNDSPTNLRGLCEKCHKKKTAQDGAARKRAKSLANTIRTGRKPRR